MSHRSAFYLGLLISVIPLISSSIGPNRDQADHLFEPSWRETDAERVAFDQPDEASEYALLKRSPDGHTPIPVRRYLDAIEHMNRMPQYSTASRAALPSVRDMRVASIEPQSLGSWTALGPGNIGGRTRALLIDPNDPNVFYAAGVAGGVWKSTNSGRSWSALGDLLPNIAVSSLAFDPTNTQVIYAGTGEGFFNSDSARGGGIFKTTDGGTSWSLLASTSTGDFFFVNKIVISTNDHNRVYCATRTGVWRSPDGGQSWTRSLNPLNAASITVNAGCLDLAIRTDQPTDYLFASCGTMVQATP